MQLMHVQINSLDNNSEYYINRLVYVLELSKAKFCLPVLLQGRIWEEHPLYLPLETRVLSMAFLPFETLWTIYLDKWIPFY